MGGLRAQSRSEVYSKSPKFKKPVIFALRLAVLLQNWFFDFFFKSMHVGTQKARRDVRIMKNRFSRDFDRFWPILAIPGSDYRSKMIKKWSKFQNFPKIFVSRLKALIL